MSTLGGSQPLWARTGRELFYVDPDGALLAVPVDARGERWSAGASLKLLDGRYFTGRTLAGQGPSIMRNYDVSADGQRFLMIKEAETDPQATPPSLVVVQHFDEELKARVPVK